MKTLKSMLAVATAVGLATAVQAVQDKDVSTGFEKLNVGTRVVTGIPDTQNADNTFPSGLNSYFKYAGANADDNESAIVEFTEADVAATEGKRPKGVSKFTGLDATARAKALQVSTGTDPLLRTFAEQSSTSLQSINTTMYVDTLVQFTVTPHDDTVTPSTDDKLMIYLKETKTVTPAADEGSVEAISYSTNLMVTAGYYDNMTTSKTNAYTLTVSNGVKVEAGKWYRLTVEMIPNIFSSSSGMTCLGFLVKIDGNACTLDSQFLSTSMQGVYGLALSPYSLQNIGELIIPVSGRSATTLEAVGFAGEGKVDDFVYTSTDPTANVVDFTFGFDRTKVSSVSYTVAGASYDEAKTFEDVEVGSLVEITGLTFAGGYEFDKYELDGLTATNTTESVFKINDDATGNVSLTIVAKEKVATYPTYVADADDTVKGNYDTWLGGVSGIAAGGDASGYENQFLLNQAASTTIADNALVIKSITENTNGGWDIVIGCSVEGVGLSTTEGENAQVCNGYLAVSYTSDLSGSWTKENINVEAGTETGTVKVNVNKNGAKFMKVSLETTKTSTTQE